MELDLLIQAPIKKPTVFRRLNVLIIRRVVYKTAALATELCRQLYNIIKQFSLWQTLCFPTVVSRIVKRFWLRVLFLTLATLYIT